VSLHVAMEEPSTWDLHLVSEDSPGAAALGRKSGVTINIGRVIEVEHRGVVCNCLGNT